MYNPPENRLKRASIEHTICTFWKHNKESGMSESTDRGKHVRPESNQKTVHLHVQRLADLDPCSDAIFSTSKRSGRSRVDTASKVVRSQLPVIFTGLGLPFEHWFSLLQLASTMSPLRNMVQWANLISVSIGSSNQFSSVSKLNLSEVHVSIISLETNIIDAGWLNCSIQLIFRCLKPRRFGGWESMMTEKHGQNGEISVTCATLPNFWWEKCNVPNI